MCYAAICNEDGSIQFFGGTPKGFHEGAQEIHVTVHRIITVVEAAEIRELITHSNHVPMRKNGLRNNEFWRYSSRKSSPRYGYWRSHCGKKFSLTDRIKGKGKAIRSLDFYGNII